MTIVKEMGLVHESEFRGQKFEELFLISYEQLLCLNLIWIFSFSRLSLEKFSETMHIFIQIMA